MSASNTEQLLNAGTEIALRLLETVASNTHVRGARFKLEVVRDIVVDGAVVIPAGAQAEGEVIHAAKPGLAGKPGELILTVRSVQAGDRSLKMRSFTAGNGEDRFNLANGLGVTLGIPGMFVVGKNIAVPAGAEVFAKLAEDTVFSAVKEKAPVTLLEPKLDVESLPGEDGNENTTH